MIPKPPFKVAHKESKIEKIANVLAALAISLVLAGVVYICLLAQSKGIKIFGS